MVSSPNAGGKNSTSVPLLLCAQRQTLFLSIDGSGANLRSDRASEIGFPPCRRWLATVFESSRCPGRRYAPGTSHRSVRQVRLRKAEMRRSRQLCRPARRRQPAQGSSKANRSLHRHRRILQRATCASCRSFAWLAFTFARITSALDSFSRAAEVSSPIYFRARSVPTRNSSYR